MRRVLAIVVTTAIALSLTSCAAGPNAETRKMAQVTDGVEKAVKTDGVDIRIANITVVATETGDAVLVGTITNRGEEVETLLGTSIAGTQATVTGLTELKQNAPITFEGDVANAKAVVKGLNLVPGTRVTVLIGFAKSGLVSLNAIVRDKSDIYANVTA